MPFSSALVLGRLNTILHRSSAISCEVFNNGLIRHVGTFRYLVGKYV
jgi:hypothetical protein